MLLSDIADSIIPVKFFYLNNENKIVSRNEIFPHPSIKNLQTLRKK